MQILDKYYNSDQYALQPGVMGSVASTGITASINVSTRVITFTNFPTNDAIWFGLGAVPNRLMLPSNMPSPGTPTATALSTSNRFAYITLDAVPSSAPGGDCSYVLTQGTEQTSAALAIANLTTPATGNIRIWDAILSTAGGNYTFTGATTGSNIISGTAGRDRRPWARGYNNVTSYTGADISAAAASVTLTQVRQRAELVAGNTLRVCLYIARMTTGTSGVDMYIFPGILNGLYRHVMSDSEWTLSAAVANYPTAASQSGGGSFLIAPVMDTINSGNLGTATINGAWGMSWEVKEIIGPNQNNGTS